MVENNGYRQVQLGNLAGVAGIGCAAERSYREQIRSFYQERGFAKVSVQVSVPRTDVSEGEPWTVDVSVVEGVLFRIGQIEIQGNTRFSEEEIGELYPKPGNLAQWAQLKRANSLLKGKYRDLGYRVVKIKTRATTQKADTSRRTEGIFNYRVQIGEGPQS